MKGIVLTSFLLKLSLFQGHVSDPFAVGWKLAESFVQVPYHTSEGQKRQGVGQICDNYVTVSFAIALSTTSNDPHLLASANDWITAFPTHANTCEHCFGGKVQCCGARLHSWRFVKVLYVLFFEQFCLLCTTQPAWLIVRQALGYCLRDRS